MYEHTTGKPLADLWIFGYGSLIFRADFPYMRREPAILPDWTRRFWQASTDHRGTPTLPGRVVTLVPTPGQNCWGMAYQIAQEEAENVLSHLDYREKGGYQRLSATLTLTNQMDITAITYLADANNPEYLGESSLMEMAQQIVTAKGPSGPNLDYLLQLEDSLKQHDVIDEHVFQLARVARALVE